jgi:hypothetical protein
MGTTLTTNINIDCGDGGGKEISPLHCSCPAGFSGNTDEVRISPTCSINLKVIQIGYLILALIEFFILLPTSIYHVYCVFYLRRGGGNSMQKTQDKKFAIAGLAVAATGTLSYGYRSLNPDQTIGTSTGVTFFSCLTFTCQNYFMGQWMNRIAYFVVNLLKHQDTALTLFAPYFSLLYVIPVSLGGICCWFMEYFVQDLHNDIFEIISFSTFRAIIVVAISQLFLVVLVHRLSATLAKQNGNKYIYTISLLKSTRNYVLLMVPILFITCISMLTSQYLQLRSSYVYLAMAVLFSPQQFDVVRWGMREQEIYSSPTYLRFLLMYGSSNRNSDDSRNMLNQRRNPILRAFREGGEVVVDDDGSANIINNSSNNNSDGIGMNNRPPNNQNTTSDESDSSNGIYAPIRRKYISSELHSSIPESAIHAQVVLNLDKL